mmetsp:Transcript_21211/g.31996  ORF Transcript_21211/g.31996 Transcript_21211/m.31996 type:complete len:245 (+) Transcript_21211:107-841(+)
MMLPSGSKQRFLCLHGLHQNKKVFQAKLSAIIDRFRRNEDIEFTFLNGAYVVPPKILQDVHKAHRLKRVKVPKKENSRFQKRTVVFEDYRGWWNPWVGQGCLDGVLRPVLYELCKGGVTGVIGFSQGAALAHLLCCSSVATKLGWSPSKVIFSGGFVGKVELSGKCFAGDMMISGVQTLHIWGETDLVIPMDKSKDLYNKFQLPIGHIDGSDDKPHTFYQHSSGHSIPVSDSALVDAIEAFIRK